MMGTSRKPVLLDTCILIDLLRKRPEAVVAVRRLVAEGRSPVVSAVNIAELYSGMRTGERAATEELLAAVLCHPVSIQIAKRAGNTVAERRQIGRTHTLDDMLIAATAVEQECALLTANRKDFDVPGLELYEL